MPFDEGDWGDDGWDGADCDVCVDAGFVHVLRITTEGRLVEALPCPADCDASAAWSAQIDRAEASMREAMNRIFGPPGGSSRGDKQ